MKKHFIVSIEFKIQVITCLIVHTKCNHGSFLLFIFNVCMVYRLICMVLTIVSTLVRKTKLALAHVCRDVLRPNIKLPRVFKV